MSVTPPEEWRPIEGHDYEVSSQGQVRSVGRWGNTRFGEPNRWFPGKTLRQEARNKYGHRRVTLYGNGTKERRAVHQLVMEAFGSPRPEGKWVLHRDGNPSNNAFQNLYYGTPSDNQYDRVAHGNNANALKTTCPHGHSLDGVRRLGGKYRGRYCKTCERNRQQVARIRLAAERTAV